MTWVSSASGLGILRSVNGDDYSAATVRVLRDRAGNRCSMPRCQRPTVGPGAGPSAPTTVTDYDTMGRVTAVTGNHVAGGGTTAPDVNVTTSGATRASCC